MLNSHKCISSIYVRQFSLAKLPFLISVHLKISALFVVSHFLSAQLSPEIIEVKVTPPSSFGGVPSYFEAPWYPHLYFYLKSNT